MQTDTGLNTGYFICDRRGNFLSANEALFSLAGYGEDELLELNILDLMAEEDQQKFLDQFTDMEGTTRFSFETKIVSKTGQEKPVEFKMNAIIDESDRTHVIGFRGHVVNLPDEKSLAIASNDSVDQNRMVAEMIDIIHLGYNEPLGVLLKRISETICQVFGFNRSTIALLNRRKRAFVKQAMVGYSSVHGGSLEQRALEVPQEVIDRIFSDRYKIKVIYHNQDQRDTKAYLSPGMPERRTEKRHPEEEWHKRDLILLNLMDRKGKTFGYISLDDPLEQSYPTRSTFHNLELFSSLISVTIENYYRFSNLERRNRRLKQVLVNSNIFKLYLSLSELLKEVVWSVKFTLDFNLVSLVLISKKTGMLETKAVACDDKIKLLQIRELKYDLKEFSDLLKERYREGKSYFVRDEEAVLHHLKRIYYGARIHDRIHESWPVWGAILVPIKSRDGKIIGFILVDDPSEGTIPNRDMLSILEIMANQIAVAIDNRVMYVQAREKNQSVDPPRTQPAETKFYEEKEDYSGGGLRKLVEKFLR